MSAEIVWKEAIGGQEPCFRLKKNICSQAEFDDHKSSSNLTGHRAFLSGSENVLIAISPNADMILFSCPSPERLNFLAKLRIGSNDEYMIKSLEIPLDHDEQITNIACLPMMSSHTTAVGIVDCTALVYGLSSGYIKFYTEQSVCLLTLKLFETPVTSIKCETQKNIAAGRSESHFGTIVDELIVASKFSAVVIDGIGLYENLKISKEDSAKNGHNFEPAYDVSNLPVILTCQRWRFSYPIVCADSFGTKTICKFDQLRSSSINFDFVPSRTCAKTLAAVGCNPSLTFCREPRDSGTHSVTEIIGSFLPFWGKPNISRIQMSEIQSPSCWSLFDRDRSVSSLEPSPDRRLAATTDSFGRVMLIDMTNGLAIRIWKGYRNAQIGWIEVRKDPEDKMSQYASFLVIYAPRRGILEIWSSQRGPRVIAFNVGKCCRLLYPGYNMLNMRAEVANRDPGNSSLLIDQSYATNCYLLNIQSGNIYSIEIPYTYSLYKFSDIKSRDHLLVSELTSAMHQNSEVDFLSEILNRMSLAESIQIAIKNIAASLSPDRIIPLMENLMDHIMKGYFESDKSMSDDDKVVIELCKRTVRLCSLFNQLSTSATKNIETSERDSCLIDTTEEQPQEVDEFAEKLGWTAQEILRYLSLAALERSYSNKKQVNSWPHLGEPLSWEEFVSCFDLALSDKRPLERTKDNVSQENPEKISIRLQRYDTEFLNEDRVIKTAFMMYNRLSESFYLALSGSATSQVAYDCYSYLDPSSRLVLLLQFWLSTKLCNHWRMWAFLHEHVGTISDELIVNSIARNDDSIIVETWKQVCNLILDSDNLYAALIATATIRSDTIRGLNKDRLSKEESQADAASSTDLKQCKSSVDWECLLIDVERLSMLGQQIEDVFLVNLLLRYSPTEGHTVDRYVYSLPRISVANMLKSGPTQVSELVAQWALQSKVDLSIFTKPYGHQADHQQKAEGISQQVGFSSANRWKLYSVKSPHHDNEEHAMELLHHTKIAFPRSLDPDVILINCFWEFCHRWLTNRGLAATDRAELLDRAFDCLPLLSSVKLRIKLASLAYKTFFQRALERLVILVETNGTIMSSKNSRLRDTLTRKELNMGDDCLESFVQFCCDLSEFMLQALGESNRLASGGEPEDETTMNLKLLAHDDWWSTPLAVKILNESSEQSIVSESISGVDRLAQSSSLAGRIVATKDLLSADVLVEINRLANLVSLIFKLRVPKSFPMSLIGDESRRILRLDLQQSVVASAGAELAESRVAPLADLRQKFARKCILSIVSKLGEEAAEPNEATSKQADSSEGNDTANRGGQLTVATPKPKPATTRRGVRKTRSSPTGPDSSAHDSDEDNESLSTRDENNESMVLFTNLLTIANEWQLNRDELYLELVFELYRHDLDKVAAQISTRVQDQQTLANGLLKVCSQRVLVLLGLSPSTSPEWRKRIDKWSGLQPNVSSWLKSIQQEEMRRELAPLSLSGNRRPSVIARRRQNSDSPSSIGDDRTDTASELGLPPAAVRDLAVRTKTALEAATNHLDGQASRLAYDLLQFLGSKLESEDSAAG